MTSCLRTSFEDRGSSYQVVLLVSAGVPTRWMGSFWLLQPLGLQLDWRPFQEGDGLGDYVAVWSRCLVG
ncbi:hypothetical protein F2Q68_00043975 [Brassica cretica]|uniref:Uncharacterized protein n=1 Tax=Brassica cretica TaxID=69181 RepID=A0A8S9LMX7_BRACR|nr:hypothetical protein F2Q68_00043975 [Brassica cretica]